MNNYFQIENFTKNGALGISYNVFEEIALILVNQTKGASIPKQESIFHSPRPIRCEILNDGIVVSIALKVEPEYDADVVTKTIQDAVETAIFEMTEIKPKKVEIKLIKAK